MSSSLRAAPRRVVVITRSTLREPPRLRHQVAELLAANGHEVLFVEKPAFCVKARPRQGTGLASSTSGELIHHQARVARPASVANAMVVRWSLGEVARTWRDAAVVNFNYDYWMLRDLWPSARMVTIINDDFVSRARPWAATEARWAQRRTLQASDAVLTVSYPLLRQCRADAPDAALFLPWARTPYRPPAPGRREDLLYWGYINDRIDWDVVEGIAAAGRVVHFAGPIERSPTAHRVLALPNIRYHGVASLAELAPVIATCCASILPYALERSKLEVTINNRAFDLLGAGLPLLYADFPELLEASGDVIHRCRTLESYLAAATRAAAGFEDAQAPIQAFLGGHTAESRYQQLAPLLSGERQSS